MTPTDFHPIGVARGRLFGLYGILVAFCVGLFVLSLSFLVWQNINQAKADFKQFGVQVNDSLRATFVINETILDGFAAYLAGVGVNEQQRAQAYTRNMLNRYSNLYMFQAAQHVTLQQIEGFERALSKQVNNPISVRRFSYDQGFVPAKQTNQQDFYPLVFVEPETGTAFNMLGLDISSFPFVRVAMLQSMTSGVASISESFELIEGEDAFVMVKPTIFDNHKIPNQYALLLVKTKALSQGINLNEPGLNLTVQYGEQPPLLELHSQGLSLWEQLVFPRLLYSKQLAVGRDGVYINISKQLGVNCLNAPLLILLLLGNMAVCVLIHLYLRKHYRSELERAKSKSKLYQRANYDRLTGLANRYYFEDYIVRALAGCQRRADKVALLYLDLNDFKQINDEFGHHLGDRVLTLTSSIILDCIRMDDVASRFGGDEFVVLLEHVTNQDDAKKVVWRIHEELAKVKYVDKKEIRLSASVGLAMYPEDGQTLEELMKAADSKMYAAKRQIKVLSMAEFNKHKH